MSRLLPIPLCIMCIVLFRTAYDDKTYVLFDIVVDPLLTDTMTAICPGPFFCSNPSPPHHPFLSSITSHRLVSLAVSSETVVRSGVFTRTVTVLPRGPRKKKQSTNTLRHLQTDRPRHFANLNVYRHMVTTLAVRRPSMRYLIVY